MSKLIGYTSITIDGKEIPIKLGTGAIRSFLKEFEIELYDISTIFKYITLEVDGKEVELPTPLDPFKFAATVLWSGADFVNRLEGGKGFPVEIGYEWIDELGGIDSAPVKAAYRLFFNAIKNGGAPIKDITSTIVPQKKAEKKSKNRS